MFRVLLLLVVLAPAAAAQTFDFYVRGNGQIYDNFFQAPEDGEEETVTALAAEVGASVGVTKTMRAYGNVNYIHFNDSTLEGSPGVRIGLRGDARPHAFDVYAEQLNNRPSFELDQFVGADVRRIVGEYSYRFLADWQGSVDAELEQQDLGGTNPGRDNELTSVGAALRWRGSRLFSPELGFRTGAREVDDDLQSYDQDEVYLQVRSQTTEKLYLSVRLRHRTRDYQHISREDKRNQLAVSADYTLNPKLVLNFYGAREHNDTGVAGNDASWGFVLAGVTWRF